MATVAGIVDAEIAANANIQSRKLQHRHRANYSQDGTIASDIAYIFIARATGSWKSIEAAITETIATGADRTVTIDLKKSTGGGAFASVLSATIVLDSSSVLAVLEAGTFSDTTIADGDVFSLNITVAGVLGNQGQGLVVTAEYDEQAA